MSESLKDVLSQRDARDKRIEHLHKEHAKREQERNAISGALQFLEDWLSPSRDVNIEFAGGKIVVYLVDHHGATTRELGTGKTLVEAIRDLRQRASESYQRLVK